MRKEEQVIYFIAWISKHLGPITSIVTEDAYKWAMKQKYESRLNITLGIKVKFK